MSLKRCKLNGNPPTHSFNSKNINNEEVDMEVDGIKPHINSIIDMNLNSNDLRQVSKKPENGGKSSNTNILSNSHLKHR